MKKPFDRCKIFYDITTPIILQKPREKININISEFSLILQESANFTIYNNPNG